MLEIFSPEVVWNLDTNRYEVDDLSYAVKAADTHSLAYIHKSPT
jgi:hypothetical protein